jgi:hypothetical protein
MFRRFASIAGLFFGQRFSWGGAANPSAAA